MRRILIIGAASAIAEATARIFASRGDALYLVARRSDVLADMIADLKVRGASVTGEVFDVNQLELHANMIERAHAALGGLDTVLIAHGTLPDQTTSQHSVQETLQQFQTNALATISLLTLLANRFESQRHGMLAVISSVAGDRGRASNYVYGTAKAAVTCFTSGLRQRLYKSGVQVLTIKPGFVDTPMTRDFSKGFLWATPVQVARCIVRGIDRRRAVIYAPAFWYWIMLVIKSLPERLFVRIRL